jgi:hypothetical protein
MFISSLIRVQEAPGQRFGTIRDLAPSIHRQRLVIEGRPSAPIDGQAIVDYLMKLSDLTLMHRLIEPVVHLSERYGWAGWVHWEASGAHFYAWNDPLFFSVDVYACAAFDANKVINFTAQFFSVTDIVSREI